MSNGSITKAVEYGMPNSADEPKNMGLFDVPSDMKKVNVEGERTGIQSIITSPWVMRWASMPTTYSTYRAIRKHPTIAIARAVSAAPVLSSEWTVESKDADEIEEKTGMDVSEVIKFVQDEFLPLRQDFLESTMLYGNVDFGYMGFEQVLDVGEEDGMIHLTKLKGLLHDITEIVLDPYGNFQGYKQPATWLGKPNSLHIGFRVEGSHLYGYPLLENVRETFYQWLDANDGAARYDRKVAGGRIVVYYPPGKSKDGAGVIRPNDQIAKTIVDSLQSSGAVAVPRDMAAFVDRLNVENPGWIIDVLDKGAGLQPQFIARLEYLDKLLCRGLLLPERSIIEGQHGTMAEAETHTDTALCTAEQNHKKVVQSLNKDSVNPLLEWNYGPKMRDMVYIVPAPLTDAKKSYLKQIYQAILSNPQGFQMEAPQIDTNVLKDNLGIPKAKEVAPMQGTDEDAYGQEGQAGQNEDMGQQPGQGQGLPMPGQQVKGQMKMPQAALDGVDPNGPVGLSIRRIYARLGSMMEN